MPRLVSDAERHYAITLMMDGEISQRDMELETGLSRPYIRKLAKQIGYQFPRNGIEVRGRVCMCANCDVLFRRAPSKADRAKRQFCSDDCREAFFKGENHPSWKHGKTAATFSQWIKNTAAYDRFREAVLKRDGHKCVISGKTEGLNVHHIFPKAEEFHPEKALDINNGITICEEVHREIHKLIHDGIGYEEAVQQLKLKYENSSSN